MNGPGSKMIRIGVFYDGNYFSHVSNYYNYIHPRKTRISIRGLHEFIRQQAAKEEGTDIRYCQVVDAHYFRGRLSAHEAHARQLLLNERSFDEILMREGVITHFLPLGLKGREKGIDVWLALEAFELAVLKKFDVVALVAGDGDFIPLARKVHTLGARVMVLGWDFAYTDEQGEPRETKVSVGLLDESTYPLLMHSVIDDKSKRNDPIINNLFVTKAEPPPIKPREPRPAILTGDRPRQAPDLARGEIVELREGYGRIRTENNPRLFFHYTYLENVDFNELREGDLVEFVHGTNDRGPCAYNVTKIEE